MQFNFKMRQQCMIASTSRITAVMTLCIAILFFCVHDVLAAGHRFKMTWQARDGARGVTTCHDSGKTCVESGMKEMDGIRTSRPCWRYTYSKTCNFPSKNDCHLISHCYEVGLKECLLRDSLGNCVNQIKEFSCKRREMSFIDHEKLKRKITGDEAKRIVCKGVPCIDGNCIDKSYDEDQDMMNSASQLYAASKTAGAKDMHFKLFAGFAQNCKKKPTGYLNCCKKKGWGGSLGAKCTKDEQNLQDMRAKKLCVYVGKNTTGTRPMHVNKHNFCCFGNMLNKVFQVQGRKQLGRNFGSSDSPDCGGLTLEEIMRLDFQKMDFSEFVAEIKGRMKIPNVGDLEMRTKGSLPNMKKYNDTGATSPLDPDNKRGGVNAKQMPELQDEGAYGK